MVFAILEKKIARQKNHFITNKTPENKSKKYKIKETCKMSWKNNAGMKWTKTKLGNKNTE